jgi:hypothetical protein
MALSRMVPGLAAVLLLATPASAQPVGDYRLPPSPRAPPAELQLELRDCPVAADDEIVVCGDRREDERHRLPLPLEREPGAADRAGGEQMAALNAGTGRCSTTGPHVQCAGGLDLIGIAFQIARALLRARANRD